MVGGRGSPPFVKEQRLHHDRVHARGRMTPDEACDQDRQLPGTTVDEVSAMLGDQAFREAVGGYQRVVDYASDITPSGGAMTVRIDQATPPTDAVVRARSSASEIRIVQSETWTSPTRPTSTSRSPASRAR